MVPAVPSSSNCLAATSTVKRGKRGLSGADDTDSSVRLSVGESPQLFSRLRRDALPELVENDTVEEGECFDDLAVAQIEEPGIRISVGFAVARRTAGIEENDDRVAFGVDIADCRLQANAHAGVERPYHLTYEGLFAGIGLRCRRMTDDGLTRVVGQQIIRATGAGTPGVEAGPNDCFVAGFDFVLGLCHSDISG